MYQHQDWTPVIFKKKNETQVKQFNKTVSQLQPQYKAKLHEDSETFQTKYFDKEFADSVIKKRVEKKLNQKQLASLVNVDVHVIQRLEQGKEPYDHVLKNKLNRALGM